MKRIIRYILFATLTLSLALPASVNAQTRTQSTQMTAQQKQRAAEKAKRDKERQKQQEARQKQQQKAQAERAKQQQKAQADKEKAAAEREKQQQKATAEAAKQEEKKAAADEKKYAPRKQSDAIHYFNLSARAGYAAMFDNLGAYGKTYTEGAGYPLMDKSLTGGPGAGLQLSYELAYHAFRFETGIGFDWLNSRSDYAFSIERRLKTYPQTYTYMTDDLREVRNIGLVSIPVMAGAQFSRYYFMLGARVGYGIFGTFSQKGLYDVTVVDDDMLKPYGAGIIDAPKPESRKLTLRQPDVRLAAEFGLDLDEWLQAEPAKGRKQPKPGQRYPFGREYIHYKVALFADYGILNSNNMSGALPLVFADNGKMEPTGANSVLAIGEGSKLNNLFVGAKFTVQFEVPGKRPTVPPVRPTYLDVKIVDAATNQPISAKVAVTNLQKNKEAVPREVRNGTMRRTIAKGDWRVDVTADDYFAQTQSVTVDEPGHNQSLTIMMQHVPYFRLRITDSETGKPLPANAQIICKGATEAQQTMSTDSVSGSAKTILDGKCNYVLHVDLIGYDSYEADIASVADSMNVQMRPVKKGEVFVMKNLFFATNKTRILKASEESLNELYGFLSRNADIRVKIIGHTDNVGSDSANQKLSEGRANAVRDDLIDRGIDPSRLEAEGRGESQPIDTNDTEEGRQNNRRVEVEVL
ncbi:MAG: OmpA family protein [Paludibacteraceae bacterium]|nr:OmpA family protein [Paludibacteraceae bacterium]